MRLFVANLENELAMSNPRALASMREHVHGDFTPLKRVLYSVLNSFEQFPVEWNPCAGDRAIVACLQVFSPHPLPSHVRLQLAGGAMCGR